MFEKPYVTIDRTPVPVELTETHIVDPIQTPHLNRLGEWTVKFHLDTPTYTLKFGIAKEVLGEADGRVDWVRAAIEWVDRREDVWKRKNS